MPQDQITEIKKRIKESREKRGYSVKEIADIMGVCVQSANGTVGRRNGQIWMGKNR